MRSICTLIPERNGRSHSLKQYRRGRTTSATVMGVTDANAREGYLFREFRRANSVIDDAFQVWRSDHAVTEQARVESLFRGGPDTSVV